MTPAQNLKYLIISTVTKSVDLANLMVSDDYNEDDRDSFAAFTQEYLAGLEGLEEAAAALLDEIKFHRVVAGSRSVD